MPVCSGSVTGWRWTTPGALNSAGRFSEVTTSPLPSSGDVVGQVEHLERHAVLEPVDAGDAVGHGQHGADLGQVRAAGVEALDATLQD